MKFTVNRKELIEALTLTGKGIGKSVVPAVTGYLFAITQDKLKVTGGNMEMYIHNSIDIQGSGFDFSLIAPIKLLELLKQLAEPSTDFEILTTQTETVCSIRLKVKSGKNKYDIPVMEGDSYPAIKIDKTIDFEVVSNDIIKGIDKTLFATGDDDLRPAMTCVNLTLNNGRATYMGCNGHVASIHRLGDVESDGLRTILIPKTSSAVLKDLPFDESTKIRVSNNAVSFSLWDGLEFQSILSADRYIDVKAVIPTDNDKHLEVDRLQLIAAIRRVMIFANKKTSAIALKLNSGTCEVFTDDDVEGNAVEQLPASYDHKPLTIGFNGILLLNALQKIDSEVVSAELSDEKRAMLLHDGSIDIKNKENFLLVMPVVLFDKIKSVGQ